MADSPAPLLPRAALERVLLRAAELHAANSETPETMSEADLLALAKEVGISPVAVKQALAEERMRVAPPEVRGAAAMLAGPALFTSSRVVAGNAREILDRLDKTFQRDENLSEVRRFPDRIVWAPRGGLAGALHDVAAGLGGRTRSLHKANEVSASVVQVEPGKVHVRIEASFVGKRETAIYVGLGGVLAGGAAAAILGALNVWPSLSIGAGLVLGGLPWIIARSTYRGSIGRAQLGLEQALDHLEFGEPKKRGIIDQFLIGDG